jgi:hypothetical protein
MNDTPHLPDDLLGSIPQAPANPVLRQELLHRTLRRLRLRLWLRRGTLAASLAACYAAGLATMHFWSSPPAANTTPDSMVSANTTPGPPVESLPGPQLPPDSEVAPEILEQWGPLVSADQRAALLRRAGDRYLSEANDLQGALRCYRQYLDSASEHELAISTDDNWFLMSLKDARLKEKRDAKFN